MSAKAWTPEEVDYLQERWGTTSVPAIAQHLGRSINAIKLKAARIGLPGNPINASEYITFLSLMEALGKKNTYGWAKERWARFGCPIKYKRMMNKRIAMIRIEDFWEWAEQHQDILDFSDFEEYAIGAEPAWVKQKRRRDIRQKIRRDPWTPEEDARLRAALNEFRYTYDDLQRMFNRSEGAIRRRIGTLGIKALPIRNPGKWWTEEEKAQLVEMREAGNSWEAIAEALGRSASACRGRYERILNPEYMRRYMRDNKLRLRDCFQKDSCTHYTKAKGCDIHGTDCDACPHYCRRPSGEDVPTGWISTKAGMVGTERVRAAV